MASSDLKEIGNLFGGTWVLDRSENFNELLEVMGVGYILKKVAQKATPEMSISVTDTKVVVKRKGLFKDSEIQLELGADTDVEEFGNKVTSHVTFENGKLIAKNKPKDGEKSTIKEHTATREINEKGEMVQTIVVKDLTAKRIFKKK